MDFIDLKTSYRRLSINLEQRYQQVMESGAYILGPVVEEFEQKLASYTGAAHCISCANGTEALYLALLTIPQIQGKLVFTTPYTFIATSEAITWAGAIPVFVDVEKTSFNINPVDLEEKLSLASQGKLPIQRMYPNAIPAGIMAVNLFGNPASYTSIMQLANKYGLTVIEDAAQSFGASENGKMSCQLAHIGCTSFYPTKPLGGYGDGGAIFTSNDQVAKRLHSLRNHGQEGSRRYEHVSFGINSRLDALQAAFLIEKLSLLPSEIKARQHIAMRYMQAFNSAIQSANPNSHVTHTQYVHPNAASAWAHFSVLVKDRSMVQSLFKQNDIPSMVYYPIPLHMQPVYTWLGYQKGSLPNAEFLSDHMISIPMHPYLSNTDQDKVIDVLLGRLA